MWYLIKKTSNWCVTVFIACSKKYNFCKLLHRLDLTQKLHSYEWSFYLVEQIQKDLTTEVVRSVFALPIFPGSHPPSIVGVHVLNFCVRDGNRWTHMTINTNYIYPSLSAEITFGDPYRIRTDVNGVRGRCLNHLTNGPWCTFRDSNPGPTD